MKLPKLALPTDFKISMPKLKKDKPVELNLDASSKEAKQKKILRGAIAVMAVVFVALAMNNQGTGAGKGKKASKLPAVSSEQVQQNKDMAKAEGKGKKSKIHITTDIANINPFVADDTMEGSDVVVDAATSSPMHTSPRTASADLPVIPGRQPKVNLPVIPNGGQGQRQAEAGAQPQQNAPAKVQGVFIGGDNNMAVMSDGSVVSEGQYYNDNRVSWIGGDGIHFENGESIRYR